MAKTKATRPTSSVQPVERSQHSAPSIQQRQKTKTKTSKAKLGKPPRKGRKPRLDPKRELVAVPQAVGKTVEELTVSNAYDDNGIDIYFDDHTGLAFSFDAVVKMRAAVVDSPKGEWRAIKRWSRVRPE